MHLGKRLHLCITDLYINNERPVFTRVALIREIVPEISSKRLGCFAVVENYKLVGIITDGGLRRMLEGITEVIRLKSKGM